MKIEIIKKFKDSSFLLNFDLTKKEKSMLKKQYLKKATLATKYSIKKDPKLLDYLIEDELIKIFNGYGRDILELEVRE